MQLNVTISDKTTPRLQKMLGSLTQRQPLLTRLGKVLEVQLRNHFANRNNEPNKRGWPKQNFWIRIRRATALSEVTNDSATVTISDPAFAHKVTGGTVSKPGGALAIPLRKEAYGISPGGKKEEDGSYSGQSLPALFLLRSHGRLFLAKREDADWHTSPRSTLSFTDERRRQKRKTRTEAKAPARLTLYYILLRSVTHSADPAALPPESSLAAALEAEAAKYLDFIR